MGCALAVFCTMATGAEGSAPGVVWASQFAHAATPLAAAPVATGAAGAASGPEASANVGANTRPAVRALTPRSLLQLALAHNHDVHYARLQAQVAALGHEAETGLYQPVTYANARREGRSRQRTLEEQLTAALGGIGRLDEAVTGGEMGVRARAPTGAEGSLAWRATRRSSNIIASSPLSVGDSESNAAVVLVLKQPLLRGRGQQVVETDLRVSAAERELGRWQYRQQVLRVSSEALAAYWQLQRAQASLGLRRAALQNALDLAEDAALRLGGGRIAPAALDEANALVAGRQAETDRAQQQLAESEARLRVLLDLPAGDGGWALAAATASAVAPAAAPAGPLGAAEEEAALQSWPPLRMAMIKRTQAQDRLQLAQDRALPSLDVQLQYSSNALATSGRDAASQAWRNGGRNPDWTVGLVFEMPFGGDVRAKAQAQAQALRLEQAETEIRSVRQALLSDLHSRRQQWRATTQELVQTETDAQAREALLQTEQIQFDQGSAPRNRLLRRKADVIDAQLRLADVRARVEQARLAVQLADGSLLQTHGIQLED